MASERLRYHIKSALIVAAIGFPTGLIFCQACRSDFRLFMTVGVYAAILWVVLWKGNEAVAGILDLKVDWAREPVKRLVLGLLGHIIFTVLAMFVLNFTVFKLFGWNSDIQSFQGLINYSLPAIIITIIISSIMTARAFFIAWRQLAVNEEKIKKELAVAQYEALKNQVNPHFLFNSLNVLSSLVYRDSELSAKFIKQLSNVYRYVLEVKDKQLVNLSKEIDFLNSYTFLLKMRHLEGLQVNIDVPDNKDYELVPLALQMLVENAVKHNSISVEEPLKIDVLRENGYLVVRNNLQIKQKRNGPGSELGLSNIKARYQFLSDKEVLVKENNSIFEVKLPLLMLEK